MLSTDKKIMDFLEANQGKTIQQIFSNMNKDLKKSSGEGENYQIVHHVDAETKVRVKVSFGPLKAVQNSQRVESQIYEHVLTNLRKHTPHIPKWYSTLSTSFDLASTCIDTDDEWIAEWDTKNATALIIEDVEGKQLYQNIQDDPHILFQILYTLACFDRVGLRHSDLHQNNVLITDKGKEEMYSYEVCGRIVSFKSQYHVTIIDYDLSTIYDENVERNGQLDLIRLQQNVSYYNGYNPRSDTFKFLHDILDINTSSVLAKWIRLARPRFSNFPSECEGMLPIYISGDTYVGSLEELLIDLATSFFETFDLDHCATEQTYKLPMIKPPPHGTKYSVNVHQVLRDEEPDFVLQEEFSILGYNWFAHAHALYSDCFMSDAFGKSESDALYEACWYLTCPLKLGDPIEEAKVLMPKIEQMFPEHLKTVLHIPCKRNPQNKFYGWIRIEEKVKEPKFVSPPCKCAHAHLEDMNVNENKSVTFDFNVYTNGNVNKRRKMVQEIMLKHNIFLPILEKEYDGTFVYVQKYIKSMLDSVSHAQSKVQKILMSYALFGYMSRMMHHFRVHKNFLNVVKDKINEFRDIGIDYGDVMMGSFQSPGKMFPDFASDFEDLQELEKKAMRLQRWGVHSRREDIKDPSPCFKGDSEPWADVFDDSMKKTILDKELDEMVLCRQVSVK